MLAAWPLLIAVVARLPSCSWESGGAVTVAINITGFASPCATDSHSAEKVRSHIPAGAPGKRAPRPASALFSRVDFDQTRDALVFLHIPKAGGTTFNQRLTTLETDPPCVATPSGREAFHNGHANVEVHSCSCSRSPAAPPATSASPLSVAAQWLVSPVTTGWLGGVHTPLRYLQAEHHQRDPWRASPHLHFVTMLREPLARTISEYYETYDGWEFGFHTPYRPKGSAPGPPPLAPCSASLGLAKPPNIDRTSKAVYDSYFPRWLRCRGWGCAVAA